MPSATPTATPSARPSPQPSSAPTAAPSTAAPSEAARPLVVRVALTLGGDALGGAAGLAGRHGELRAAVAALLSVPARAVTIVAIEDAAAARRRDRRLAGPRGAKVTFMVDMSQQQQGAPPATPEAAVARASAAVADAGAVAAALRDAGIAEVDVAVGSVVAASTLGEGDKEEETKKGGKGGSGGGSLATVLAAAGGVVLVAVGALLWRKRPTAGRDGGGRSGDNGKDRASMIDNPMRRAQESPLALAVDTRAALPVPLYQDSPGRASMVENPMQAQDAAAAAAADLEETAAATGGEWLETKDPASGNQYWYNSETGATSWSKP